jgi:hypothetical protein
MHEFSRSRHIGAIAVDSRIRSRAFAGPVEVCAVTAAPLPRIVEIEDRFHIAALKLGHQPVEAVENSVVILPGGCLKYRLYMVWLPFGTVRTHKHAQIADADALQEVEFGRKTITVAAAPCAAEYGSIP